MPVQARMSDPPCLLLGRHSLFVRSLRCDCDCERDTPTPQPTPDLATMHACMAIGMHTASLPLCFVMHADDAGDVVLAPQTTQRKRERSIVVL